MRGLAMTWCLLLSTATAYADQDDVPVGFTSPEVLFAGHDGEGGDWLTASTSRVDIATYPVGRYHTWHGRIGADVAVARIGTDALYRMGLAMQTVADHRNDISFRLVRLYYDATQLVEHRFGAGVVHLGLRHRCTHGADTAVDGRILIRSGPELGYDHVLSTGKLRLTLGGFLHGTMIGQNDDPAFKPRALLAGKAQASWHPGSWTLFVSAGFGAALVSSGTTRTFGFASAYDDLSVLPLPAAALGLLARGRATAFTSTLHFSRMLDSGIGAEADSAWLLALELGFQN